MYQRFHAMREQREGGFTLIELLVVILIIAILAAIAIPVFLRQRERGYEAQAQSAVKNAATAVESYATQANGDYSGATGWTGTAVAGASNDLTDFGYSNNPDAPVTVTSDVDAYCITANHASLGTDWKYASKVGKPATGTCAAADL